MISYLVVVIYFVIDSGIDAWCQCRQLARKFSSIYTAISVRAGIAV